MTTTRLCRLPQSACIINDAGADDDRYAQRGRRRRRRQRGPRACFSHVRRRRRRRRRHFKKSTRVTHARALEPPHMRFAIKNIVITLTFERVREIVEMPYMGGEACCPRFDGQQTHAQTKAFGRKFLEHHSRSRVLPRTFAIAKTKLVYEGKITKLTRIKAQKTEWNALKWCG